MQTTKLFRTYTFTHQRSNCVTTKPRRSNSLSNLKNTAQITTTNDAFVLKKVQKFDNIYQNYLDECFDFNSSLNFVKDMSLENLSAANYVYLGSVRKSMLNQTGITLDKDGNLILIKGKRADLCRGLYQKYISSYKYTTSTVELKNAYSSIKLDTLFISDEGKLLGKDKVTQQLYTVEIKTSIDKSNLQAEDVNIKLEPLSDGVNAKDKLCFDYIDENERKIQSSFYLNSGQLYLKELCVDQKRYNYELLDFQIDLNFKKNYYIHSVKKCINMLQLEVKNDKTNKTRIFYLDPLYINFKKLKAYSVSHKPPQNAVSGLGCDPHESYYSGQPFSSTRKANFSSKHIPLISSIIDKFRLSIKNAKPLYFNKEYGKFAKEIIRSVDPGVEYAYSQYRNFVDTKCSKKTVVDDKGNIFIQHKNAFQQSSSQYKSGLVKNNYYIDKTNKFSAIIKKIMADLNVNDSLSFHSVNEFGLFFGIAAGGLPFSPGWFAGIVASLHNNYTLKIIKKNDSLQFEFIHKSNKAVTLLAGTGQGLEDNNKLLRAANIDIITVLPAEANLIMATNFLTGSSFGFELENKNVDAFLETLTNEQQHSWIEDFIVDETKIESFKERGLVILLEAKSELRAQLGLMANNNTYLVLPRTALGIRLALGLLNLKYKNRIIYNENQRVGQKISPELSAELCSYEADLFREIKIMPIAMKSGYMGTDNVWCFPLPLQEENHNMLSYRHLPVKKLTTIDDNSLEQDKSLEIKEESKLTSINIDSSKLPTKLSTIIYDIYQYISEKQDSDIIFQQLYPANEFNEIKIFPESPSLFKQLKENFSGNKDIMNISTLINQTKSDSKLRKFEQAVNNLHKNAGRDSLYKKCDIFISCTYRMEAEKYHELKTEFYTILKNIEVKLKGNITKITLDNETKRLKKIQSLLIEKQLDDTQSKAYFLQQINVQRRSLAEQTVETLPLAILRGKQSHQIELIKNIGELEFSYCKGQLPILKKCLLHEI